MTTEATARTRRVVARRMLWTAAMISVAVVWSGCASGPKEPWEAAKETIIWPLPPDPPRIQYVGAITAGRLQAFGTAGRWAVLDLLLGRPKIDMNMPHGVAVDARTIATADSAKAVVHLLDLERGRYRSIDAAGRTVLRCPIGVALDDADGLFVTDSVLRKVFRFSRDGRLRGEVKGEFGRPTGLAYDAARRRLYVVDTGAHAVLCYEDAGKGFSLLRRLGARGEKASQFNFPTHAALDGAGNLYVTDSLNFRIQIFDPAGTLTASFGRAGDGTGDFAKIKSAAVDSEGHVYVVDSLYDVVQIFDRTGRYLLGFGGSGRGEGLLWLPTGICIDEKDRIYVADSGNSRILVYQYLRRDEAE